MTTYTRTTIWRLPLAAALTLMLGLLAGCGDDDDADTSDTTEATDETTTTEEAEESSTTEEAEETTTTAEPDETTTTEGESTDTTEVAADEEFTESTWSTIAAEFRGQDGLLVGFKCSPEGTIGSVWGTELYTDDSSVCTAAVHAGLITVEDGGRVVIEIAPGLEEYTGTEANGITSNDYASWEGSYFFPAAGEPDIDVEGGSATAG